MDALNPLRLQGIRLSTPNGIRTRAATLRLHSEALIGEFALLAIAWERASKVVKLSEQSCSQQRRRGICAITANPCMTGIIMV